MDQTDLSIRLEAALADALPRSRLQIIMGEILESGLERDEIFAALQGFRERLSKAGRADDADLIDEMIDGFTGWCILR